MFLCRQYVGRAMVTCQICGENGTGHSMGVLLLCSVDEEQECFLSCPRGLLFIILYANFC